jgi:hypothetical protein
MENHFFYSSTCEVLSSLKTRGFRWLFPKSAITHPQSATHRLQKASVMALIVATALLPLEVMARDFSGSVQSIGSDIRSVIMVLGPVMLMVAGGVFYFSRQQGVSMLLSAAIGTVIFAASSTIFMMLYHAFN